MKFIPIAEPHIGTEEKKYVLDCIESTWISSTGKYIGKFEESFAKYFGVPYAISCNNGTTALHLALLALGIGPGDEVILPAFTFVSTANVIKYVGARPVFVDIDKQTWTIDTQKIEAKITTKTKAIMPVHLYGYPADMDHILALANRYHVSVIEDAAEAHTAKYKNKLVGTLGEIGCFSFFGNKIITTGEGGMVITKSKKIFDKITLLKNHGMSPKKRYFHPIIGYNYRMTNMQAAIGYAQLKKIDLLVHKRKKIADYYKRILNDTPGLTFQPETKYIDPVCWLFSFLVGKEYGRSRDSLIKYLKTKGIDSRPFFFSLTRFPMYASKEKFPVTEAISKMGINIPSSPTLTPQQLTYIATTIRKYA